MFQIEKYQDYRNKLSMRVDQLVTPNLKKVLVFGDKFKELDSKWKTAGKKVRYLDELKDNWIELNRENPDFTIQAEKNYFDVLISYHGLEKAIDPERLLLELRKYLVKEGIFICITYNVTHISTIINLITEGWNHKSDGAVKEGNIRHFSYNSLKELLELGGFTITGEDIYGQPEMPEMTNQLIKLTKNPYLNALSFIFQSKRIESFPFIEGTYP